MAFDYQGPLDHTPMNPNNNSMSLFELCGIDDGAMMSERCVLEDSFSW